MNANLGATPLPRRSRRGCPMRSYDALPQPVRHWLSQAALPWSPASARRIWTKATRQGLTAEEAIACLASAEARLLAQSAPR